MSASFASASSQKITNAAPAITTYPFSVGLWVYPTPTGAQRTFFSLSDTAGATNYFRLGLSSLDIFEIGSTDDASPLVAVTSGAAPAAWAYVVGRFISATNRRIAVIRSSGAPAHAQSTTSDTPIGIDTMAFGCLNHSTPTQFFDGSIAEPWYTNTDIQPDGGQLQNALLQQLAIGGPFSVPHIARDIIEYRSFRKHPLVGDAADIYFGRGVQNWTDTNGVTTGPHPPLPYWYRSPKDFRRVAVI